ELEKLTSHLYDRMTEAVLHNIDQASVLFETNKPKPVITIEVLKDGIESLEKANLDLGLALNEQEISYLFNEYKTINRNPTDAELVMFAQINSEHCRHKIFNADWVIDGNKQPKSLFKMIKNTYETNS